MPRKAVSWTAYRIPLKEWILSKSRASDVQLLVIWDKYDWEMEARRLRDEWLPPSVYIPKTRAHVRTVIVDILKEILDGA